MRLFSSSNGRIASERFRLMTKQEDFGSGGDLWGSANSIMVLKNKEECWWVLKLVCVWGGGDSGDWCGSANSITLY